MRGKTLLIVRRLHLYLSVFFAPLLLMFVVTGWAQTMGFSGATPVLSALSQVHLSQTYNPSRQKRDGDRFQRVGGGERRANAAPMKWLVAAMSVALIISILLGLVLAFTMVRNRIPVWIALILGVATPVGLLTLAHFR